MHLPNIVLVCLVCCLHSVSAEPLIRELIRSIFGGNKKTDAQPNGNAVQDILEIGSTIDNTPIHEKLSTGIICPSFRISKFSSEDESIRHYFTQAKGSLDYNGGDVSDGKSVMSSESKNPKEDDDDDKLDYDAFCEDPTGFAISQENKSLVKHFIKSLKPGKDMTKFSLPVFMLEPRSRLEVFTDHFAHAQEFLKITEMTSPKERMVQVVKYYLSSFHIARKNPVAQMPYPAVLGEIFRCFWNIPGSESDSPEYKDSPVPWAKKDQLVYIAEKVSQDPPTSAFYAEHFDKRITFSAFTRTKSTLTYNLGISIENIGKGIINVLKYNEQYVLNFPTGYVRGLLTTPWVELGDDVSIVCKKSRFRAKITFQLVGYVFGSAHQIKAEVFGPDEAKPFVTVEGAWNGVMKATWPDGQVTNNFINVDALPIVKKTVRLIKDQDVNESRRLWKKVTGGIMMKNDKIATASKKNILDKEESEDKERKRNGIAWETKLFHLEGDDWVFNNPLSKRLSSDNRG